MAGGPTSTALVTAVGRAGGLGLVPAGYLTPDAFDRWLTEVAAATAAAALPWGVNLFLPGPPTADLGAVAAHAAALQPWADRFGATLGEPRWEDDAIDAKVDLVIAHRPDVVSFTFALPDAALVARLRAGTDAVLVATVTTPEEAVAATASGVDALALQGAEAGGHRGVLVDDRAHPGGGALVPLLELIARTRAQTPLPLLAAGGLMDGARIRAALDSGASGVQLGTAFLCTPEAGTSQTHRRALLDATYADTTVTRGFTGRPARGLANSLALAFPEAPSAYPEVHHLTRALRAAAAAAGEPDAVHLWAGTNWRAATEEPAADLVVRLAREAGLDA